MKLPFRPERKPFWKSCPVPLPPAYRKRKFFGAKLIVKGILLAELLYRSEQQGIASATAELPFSQIMEIEESPEDAAAAITLQLSGMDYHIGSDENPDDRRRVTLAVYLSAQACIRRSVQFRCISDVYSTVYEVTPTMSNLQCTGEINAFTRRQSVRQTIEVGVVPSAVLSTAISFDEVNVSREDNTAVLQTMAHVKLLFSGRRRRTSSGGTAAGMHLPGRGVPECSCTASVRYGGDLSVAISPMALKSVFRQTFCGSCGPPTVAGVDRYDGGHGASKRYKPAPIHRIKSVRRG